MGTVFVFGVGKSHSSIFKLQFQAIILSIITVTGPTEQRADAEERRQITVVYIWQKISYCSSHAFSKQKPSSFLHLDLKKELCKLIKTHMVSFFSETLHRSD